MVHKRLCVVSMWYWHRSLLYTAKPAQTQYVVLLQADCAGLRCTPCASSTSCCKHTLHDLASASQECLQCASCIKTHLQRAGKPWLSSFKVGVLAEDSTSRHLELHLFFPDTATGCSRPGCWNHHKPPFWAPSVVCFD